MMADIKLDTALLREYALRLRAVMTRIYLLDGRLDNLCHKLGPDGIIFLKASSMIGEGRRKLSACQQYMTRTADEFERVEREIDYNNFIKLKEKISDMFKKDWTEGKTDGGLDELEEQIVEKMKDIRQKIKGLWELFKSSGVSPEDLLIGGSDESMLKKFEDLVSIVAPDVYNRGNVGEAIEWLAGLEEDADKYKDYFEWFTGKEIEWPEPIKDGLDFIKGLDVTSEIIIGTKKYAEGLRSGDVDTMLEGSDELFDALEDGIDISGFSTTAKLGEIGVDLVFTGVQNYLESLKTETETSEVLWNTFANSALEVYQDTVLDTPTMVIAYEPAKMISGLFGYDLQAGYEKVSDKTGFAAVIDANERLSEMVLENSSWENWKSGMGVIADKVAGFFK